jgi:hypothetical protein
MAKLLLPPIHRASTPPDGLNAAAIFYSRLMHPVIKLLS